MRIFNRYLGRVVLQYSTLTLSALIGLFAFVTFLDQLGDLGHGAYNLTEVMIYVLLTIPRTIYDISPMVALLGTMVGLSLLANDSELIVMQACGLSILQITSATFKMGGIFVIIAIIVGELIAPYSQTKAEQIRAEALQKNIKQQTSLGIWVRDKENYINIGEVLPDMTLLRVKIFAFDSNKQLRSLTFAERAKYDGKSWSFIAMKQTLVGPAGKTKVTNSPTSIWQSKLTPQILSVFLTKPDQLSLRQLSRYINHLDENQQKTDSFKLAYWNRIMLPLSTMVMVILAIPFVFANIRSGTLGRSLFVGIMLGLGFYVINKGLGYIVLAAGMTPMLGAILPIVMFLLLAMVKMWQVEHRNKPNFFGLMGTKI